MPSTQQKTCTYCKGAKAVQGTLGIQKCPHCDGTGKDPRYGLFYTYRTPPTALGANQQNLQVIVTIVNWDFEVLELTGEATLPFNLPFSFLITDIGSARQFSNIAIHSSEMMGDGKNPFPWLSPYTFAKQSQIQITLNDLGAAVATPWSAVPAYTPGQIVTNGGATYICLVTNTNQAPPNAAFWMVYANTVALAFIGRNLGESTQ